jgi:hypothetical protein
MPWFGFSYAICQYHKNTLPHHAAKSREYTIKQEQRQAGFYFLK